MRSRRFVPFVVAVLGLPLLHAVAQDQPPAPAPAQNRISVRSKARLVAPADELELEIVVQGTAEEAKEAEKKHRDRLKRLMNALTGKETAAKDDDDSSDDDTKDKDKPKKKHKKKSSDETDDALPTPGVPDEDGLVYDVREGRYTLGTKGDPAQQMVDDGEDGAAKKDGELACGSCVHVTIKNLQKSTPKKVRRLLARVLDRAADAGADMGPPKTHLKPTLRFRLANAEALKKQAYGDAISRGKARAAQLAELAGRKLGQISVITDVPEGGQPVTADDGRVTDYEVYLAQLQAVDAASPDTFSGSSEIAIEVAVELEFELK